MNLTVKKTDNYQNLLRRCFSTDSSLVNIFHIKAGEGVKACAANTFEVLKSLQGFDFYALYDADKSIGYFGIEHYGGATFLTGFFLNPEYRTPEVKSWFWKQVDKKANVDTLYCGIYKKNTRAKAFLERSGFTHMHDRSLDGTIVTQLFKKDKICQQ